MQPITRDELKRMNETQHEDFVLINVLPQEEFKKAHIRTSVNIPANNEQFVEHVEEAAGSKERKVVVYCASGMRSLLAAVTLQEMGFTNVKSMAGGFAAWKAEGREVAGESW